MCKIFERVTLGMLTWPKISQPASRLAFISMCGWMCEWSEAHTFTYVCASLPDQSYSYKSVTLKKVSSEESLWGGLVLLRHVSTCSTRLDVYNL
jgi:hypothetical protein